MTLEISPQIDKEFYYKKYIQDALEQG